eukprot:CAMPEP_0115889904 /NCGR_PEP_ID=MMETSP0287-20121206/33073_1 /TAXON_ID=412157 /ORGANISM="Chrysochromulina rotalis, Strain UIO044" /LENGTH=313 /DNA_ID=CAMNT_0003346653 /DNA_START=9 /DNA_END=950 /DNA_ORIENTATION=-
MTWLHVPKCGSSFANTLFHYACPKAPHNAHVRANMAPVWPPEGIAEYWNSTYCGAKGMTVITAGVHLPSTPQDAGKLVALFRRPSDRLLSCLRHTADTISSIGPRCGSEPLVLDQLLKAFLYTHGWVDSGQELVRQFHQQQNCSFPFQFFQLPHVRARIYGVQAKLTLGFLASTSVDAPAFRAAFGTFLSHEQEQWRQLPAMRKLMSPFAFVGLVEEWEVSICLFHNIFGGATSPSELRNSREAESRSPHGHIDLNQLQELVQNHLRDPFDEAFYKIAAVRFEDDAHKHGLSGVNTSRWTTDFGNFQHTRLSI